jgi:hypothetical protein
MEVQLSRQPVQTSAHLGTAGSLGELPVGGTPLLLRLGEVVRQRSHSQIQARVRFSSPSKMMPGDAVAARLGEEDKLRAIMSGAANPG